MGSTGRQERRPLSPARENGHLHSPSLEGVEPSPKAPGINPGGEYSEVDPLLPNGCLSRTSGCELPGEVKGHHPESQEVTGESVRSMVLQILVPFLLAGLGTVMAGMLLDMVQHWEVFEKVTEIFILVPALLGLKGNLEMTLASRLSTAVNVGKMNSTKEKWNLIIGNLALKQVQATVLGLLAALAASALGWLLDEGLSVGRLALLCCSSVATAFTASLLQGLLMVGVIIGCKRMGINPDNVATPIAASFGDLITLALLALVSQGLFGCMDPAPFVAPLVCIAFLCLVPVWAIISFRHPESRRLLHSGWEPILVAMVISSMGGLILDKTISDPNLMGIVVYTPVINGIGGNLVAIQSSRVATHLHGHCALGQLPSGAQLCRTPCHTFCGKGPNCRSAQVLLVMVVPGQLLFLYLIHVIKGGEMPSNSFICFYMAAVLIQVFLLLCTADCMVHWLWLKGRDPDSFSIPYLTALGDLLGTGLLALSFYLLWVMEGH